MLGWTLGLSGLRSMPWAVKPAGSFWFFEPTVGGSWTITGRRRPGFLVLFLGAPTNSMISNARAARCARPLRRSHASFQRSRPVVQPIIEQLGGLRIAAPLIAGAPQRTSCRGARA
jgi:hypothetical protein